MTHNPVFIKNISFTLPHKTCFEGFSAHISYGSRIAIIGRNGSGKSALLKILHGFQEPSEGEMLIPPDIRMGYVPQTIGDKLPLSGGERFNAALTQALSLEPNFLLLDEPTNHLDVHNRKSLMRFLQHYEETLIVASHDRELLCHCVDSLWHIDDGKITIFSGSYDDYMKNIQIKRESLERELAFLQNQKQEMHEKRMKEQERVAKSKASGAKKVQNRKWMKSVGDQKGMKAEKSQGKKYQALEQQKQHLMQELSNIHIPEAIVPHFVLTTDFTDHRMVVQIRNGCVGYKEESWILSNINISLSGQDRLALCGDNGSGKSTLLKAIWRDAHIFKSGEWFCPQPDEIGYLDQHSNTLDLNRTVIESIEAVKPDWNHLEIRRHLNDFLFRKNEEVHNKVSHLSGGEKARLSLATIAARPPRLLLLDEITNNVDLETLEHMIQVFKDYPGAMIVISHDTYFLNQIQIFERIVCERKKL